MGGDGGDGKAHADPDFLFFPEIVVGSFALSSPGAYAPRSKMALPPSVYIAAARLIAAASRRFVRRDHAKAFLSSSQMEAPSGERVVCFHPVEERNDEMSSP